MSSDEISLQNGLNVFQDDPLRAFNCGPTRHGTKTRELAGFIDDKMFSFPSSQPPEFRGGNLFASTAERPEPRNWGSSGGDESDGEDDEDEEDDEDGDDDEGDGEENNGNMSSGNNTSINVIDSNRNSNNGGNEGISINPESMGNGKAKHHSSYMGSSRDLVVVKDGENVAGRQSNYENAVTVAEAPDGDMYYSQYLQGGEGSGGPKGVVVENGSSCGFSGRKEGSFSSESGESLRAILSDPITGSLMDDAMILSCGHSFGAGGMQHVLRVKACHTCSQPISEESVAPNLSLRAAVQAFRREEELQSYRPSKRRRERFDQEKGSYGDSNISETPRGRGVQFPFAVTDRVVIKGNKRTPQRFVGREAVVTTQCLNGWYVVKTLDNAESVKLQYRSLAKVSEDPLKPMSSKIAPNWQ